MLIKILKTITATLVIFLLPVKIVAEQPFESCPTSAFLIQNKIADLYSVNLSTGFYEQSSTDEWGQSKMNALAFNVHDQYLYAYNYNYHSVVRIDANLDVTPLSATGMPDKGFYVGDISLSEPMYYLYRPGGSYGLYKMSLDINSDVYLELNRVVNGNQLNLNIFDLAFHPNNGFAYSVDRWGNLWKIDVVEGSSEKLSNVGQSGTFGAVYFDSDENLYISRNSDGHIFRINTQWDYPTAEFFAHGPSSSNNDGARCAIAKIISIENPTTDFGSAPDSYGTSINNNGARHEVPENNIYLGEIVEVEPNAYSETENASNDNDGVQFVSNLSRGDEAILQVNTTAEGLLNAWVDFDGNGIFEDADENIARDMQLNSGTNYITASTPDDAVTGDTWARFRFSTQGGLLPTGGVADGEVEDYQIEIQQSNTSFQYYPNENSFATLAFEDNWPSEGDYDMNDLVVQYRLAEASNGSELIAIEITGQVMAMGASNHNGFAFRIPGLLRDQVIESGINFKLNGSEVSTSPLENGRDEAIIIITEDLWDYVTPGEDCYYFRTEPGCGSQIQLYFSVYLPVTQAVNLNAIGDFPYDPFLFATPGEARANFPIAYSGRSYEVHLQNQSPTEAFNEELFGMNDDDSNGEVNRFFVNSNGMPWALNIPYPWKHPNEYLDITFAYPDFHEFVNSNGAQKIHWYMDENAIFNNIFRH